jgi:hypothetical protein
VEAGVSKKSPGRKAAVDIPRVLVALGLGGEDWGPGGTSSSAYAQLAAGWRGRVPVPAEATMEAKWAELVAAEPTPQAALRARAKALFDGTSEGGVKDRAIAWLLVNQLNTLRSWDMSFKAAVAASVSLADLKARVALLPDLAQITLSAARQAYRDLLDGGSADAPPP